MIELTADQARAADAAPQPGLAIDPRTGQKYILIRHEIYDRIRSMLGPLEKNWEDSADDDLVNDSAEQPRAGYDRLRTLLDEFGSRLIQEVRDTTIYFQDATMSGHTKSVPCKTLFEQFRTLDKHAASVVRKFVLETVDECLFYFLRFIEETEAELVFRTDSGAKIDVAKTSDTLMGELKGELFTDQGWIARFSKYQDDGEHQKRILGDF